jgi:hypothetical protein
MILLLGYYTYEMGVSVIRTNSSPFKYRIFANKNDTFSCVLF